MNKIMSPVKPLGNRIFSLAAAVGATVLLAPNASAYVISVSSISDSAPIVAGNYLTQTASCAAAGNWTFTIKGNFGSAAAGEGSANISCAATVNTKLTWVLTWTQQSGDDGPYQVGNNGVTLYSDLQYDLTAQLSGFDTVIPPSIIESGITGNGMTSFTDSVLGQSQSASVSAPNTQDMRVADTNGTSWTSPNTISVTGVDWVETSTPGVWTATVSLDDDGIAIATSISAQQTQGLHAQVGGGVQFTERVTLGKVAGQTFTAWG